MKKTIEIPEGYEARIEGNKVILEPKESENERIRNLLYCLIRDRSDNGKLLEHNGVSVDMALAWLEKQGSQNLANSAKTCKDEKKHTPKHKVGDTIYYNSFGEVKSMIVTNVVTDSTDNPMYEDENGSTVFEKDLIEQNPAWTEEDKERYISCLQRLSTGVPAQPETINSKWFKERISPLIFGSLNGEQNSAWSGEDEIGFCDAMWAIEQARTIAKDENDTGNLWYAENWLKSLKERYTWKPSDEQIKVFEHFVRSIGESGYMSPYDPSTRIIYSLLDDLKRLKG